MNATWVPFPVAAASRSNGVWIQNSGNCLPYAAAPGRDITLRAPTSGNTRS